MRVVVLAALAAFALSACTGGSSSPTPSPTQQPCGALVPNIPSAALEYPASGATGVSTHVGSVAYEVAEAAPEPNGPAWSVALVPPSGPTIAGSTPTVVLTLPNGAVVPPIAGATQTTNFASGIPTLQASTSYQVQLTVAFTQDCTQSFMIGSFTTN